MIDRDRKILVTAGWLAGIVSLLIFLPFGCNLRTEWEGHRALNTVFGPPNNGDLESSLTKSVMDADDIAELEKKCGGSKHVRLVSEKWFNSDFSRNKCKMIEVLSDGAKTYEVLLEEQDGSMWAME